MRVILLSLTTVAVLLLAPAGSDADTQEGTVIERDGILYELDARYEYNRTADVVGVTEGFEGSYIEIPSSFTHEGYDYRVDSIGASAFESITDLVSVDLPQSVHRMGPRAFADCTSLEEINIPAGVTELHQTFRVHIARIDYADW